MLEIFFLVLVVHEFLCSVNDAELKSLSLEKIAMP